MNIFNAVKKFSITLVLILIPTIINSSYNYANDNNDKQTSSNEKSNKKSKDEKKASKDESNEKSNKKSKSEKKASKEEIEIIQNMFNEFQTLIENSITEERVKSFYTKHFASNTYQLFGVKKEKKDEFDKSLINSYFINLLSSKLIQETKGYKLTDKFSKISKKKSVIIKCQLKKNGENDVVDMSVTLKGKKIRDFSIMNSFQLIRGARNIVDNYCKDKKGKEYKKFKADEKPGICKEAWDENFNK